MMVMVTAAATKEWQALAQVALKCQFKPHSSPSYAIGTMYHDAHFRKDMKHTQEGQVTPKVTRLVISRAQV